MDQIQYRDIWAQILAYLGLIDAVKAKRVCKLFYRLFKLWPIGKDIISDRLTDKALISLKGAKSFNLKACKSITENGIIIIAGYRPRSIILPDHIIVTGILGHYLANIEAIWAPKCTTGGLMALNKVKDLTLGEISAFDISTLYMFSGLKLSIRKCPGECWEEMDDLISHLGMKGVQAN
jgi:hypothetical protein